MFNILNIDVPKFVCRDYGYDCDFEIENEDKVAVIDGFGKHMAAEHGIEYPKEALMQFVLRKYG